MTSKRTGVAVALLVAVALGAPAWAGPRVVKWKHLSTKTGDLQPPNAGDQQTSGAVGAFDGDAVNDFMISERTKVAEMRGGSRAHRISAEPPDVGDNADA